MVIPFVPFVPIVLEWRRARKEELMQSLIRIKAKPVKVNIYSKNLLRVREFSDSNRMNDTTAINALVEFALDILGQTESTAISEAELKLELKETK